MTYANFLLQKLNSCKAATNKLITTGLCCSIILIIGGCAAGPGDSGGSFGSTQSRRYAEDLAQQGNHAGAARQYLELAAASEGDLRQRYLILGARERYLANDIAGAERMLAQQRSSLSEINQSIWATVSAEVKLAGQQPNQALKALDSINVDDPDYESPKVLLLRAEALFQLGKSAQGVEQLMLREAGFRSRSDKLANQRLTYRGLQASGASLSARPKSNDPVVKGWLILGYLGWQQRDNFTGLQLALTEWREVHPDHPAAGILIPDMLNQLSDMLNYPDRIAVMLPLSGRQRASAEAIRDGFLAAHFKTDSATDRPEIQFYDTSAGVGAALELAKRDDADFIVGPLLKDSVDEIASSMVGTKVLALNQRSGGMGKRNFFQFALSPEDEARQVAQRAISEGHLTAVALLPSSEWGERIVKSFNDEFRKHGGRLLSAETFDAEASDYSDAIQRMLLLDQSNTRRQQLDDVLSQRTEFEPRLRQDADFIFLAANAKAAKQIRPQLRYYYAGRLPTFATSSIYQPGTRNNADLRGITFPDAPWVLGTASGGKQLEPAFKKLAGQSAMRRARLYAMGFDAYHLVPLLNGSGKIETPVNALSGKLTLDRQGKVYRELSWASIQSNGKPRPLPATPRLLLEQSDSALSEN